MGVTCSNCHKEEMRLRCSITDQIADFRNDELQRIAGYMEGLSRELPDAPDTEPCRCQFSRGVEDSGCD